MEVLWGCCSRNSEWRSCAKGKSFQAKADGFGEVVEGSKLLRAEGAKGRWQRGSWKALCAVLEMNLILWQVGALVGCQAGVGHQIAVQKVSRDQVRHDR